jgi:hypothetical protein
MKYIHGQQENVLSFEKPIREIFQQAGKEIPDELVELFNNNIYRIIVNDMDNDIEKKISIYLDDSIKNELEKLFIKETEAIRSVMATCLRSDNLHVLMSNGCSLYAGSRAINKNEDSGCKKILEESKLENAPGLNSILQELTELKPEAALDRLYEIKMYCENVLKNENATEEINGVIEKYKEAFINEFVLTIDYSKNHLHKLFIKRLMSRSAKLNRVNVFTLNYDLLIEKSTEELGVPINNGFSGFHYRTFNPSMYHQDYHYNISDGKRAYAKSLNLYKLHGSLSWKFDHTKPPYGITEIQYDFSQRINFVPECIIYPVQSKKKHSLDLPYSEMFRQFVESINKSNSTLIIMGYSFGDEHINDLITNALTNPSLNLVIFSYMDENDPNLSEYQKRLHARCKEDSRITIFYGSTLGDFGCIVRYLIPYADVNEFESIIFDTLRTLKGDSKT